MNTQPTVLITGASAGISSVYADRFAHRGHPLVLVARDGVRLNALSTRLRAEYRVNVDVLTADLTEPAGRSGTVFPKGGAAWITARARGQYSMPGRQGARARS
ncbi:MAG: SDR family NAD(P)-dependent oxidoreductase [Acetobacteraceae bacterium]